MPTIFICGPNSAVEVGVLLRATGGHPGLAILLTTAAAGSLEASRQWAQSTWAPGTQFNRLGGIGFFIRS